MEREDNNAAASSSDEEEKDTKKEEVKSKKPKCRKRKCVTAIVDQLNIRFAFFTEY